MSISLRSVFQLPKSRLSNAKNTPDLVLPKSKVSMLFVPQKIWQQLFTKGCSFLSGLPQNYMANHLLWQCCKLVLVNPSQNKATFYGTQIPQDTGILSSSCSFWLVFEGWVTLFALFNVTKSVCHRGYWCLFEGCAYINVLEMHLVMA